MNKRVISMKIKQNKKKSILRKKSKSMRKTKYKSRKKYKLKLKSKLRRRIIYDYGKKEDELKRKRETDEMENEDSIENIRRHKEIWKLENAKKEKLIEQALLGKKNILDKYGMKETDIIEYSIPNRLYGKINNKIGTGAQKIVYKGFDFVNEKEVAWGCINVSSMLPLKGDDEYTKKMKEKKKKKILDEIELFKKLDKICGTDNHIVKYFNTWYNNERKEVVIISELIDGGSLKKFIDDYQYLINYNTVKSWAKQILLGLMCLHRNNIIHRDLKLNNILIDPSTSKIYLTDFGTSIEAVSVTGPEGTPAYMAPEMLEKGYNYNNSVDMYAFGLCLLELLTKKEAYNEYNEIDLLIKKSNNSLPLPKLLQKITDVRLKTMIEKLLSNNPAERPSAYDIYMSGIFDDDEGKIKSL